MKLSRRQFLRGTTSVTGVMALGQTATALGISPPVYADPLRTQKRPPFVIAFGNPTREPSQFLRHFAAGPGKLAEGWGCNLLAYDADSDPREWIRMRTGSEWPPMSLKTVT